MTLDEQDSGGGWRVPDREAAPKPAPPRELPHDRTVPSPTRVLIAGSAAIFAMILVSSLACCVTAMSDSPLSRIAFKAVWIDQERNAATLFAFSLIAMAAFLCFAAFWRSRVADMTWRWHWLALGLILLYLSFDEAAQLHERLIDPFRTAFDTGGAFYFAWIIPGIALVALVSVLFLRFVMAQPRVVRNLIVLSAAVYVFGAIGMEMVGGAIADGIGEDVAVYYVTVTVEETLEMVGMLLFCTAVVTFLRGSETRAV